MKLHLLLVMCSLTFLCLAEDHILFYSTPGLTLTQTNLAAGGKSYAFKDVAHIILDGDTNSAPATFSLLVVPVGTTNSVKVWSTQNPDQIAQVSNVISQLNRQYLSRH